MRLSWFFSGLLVATLIGTCAFGTEKPGDKFSVSPADLPKPYATPVVDNTANFVPRPAGATLQAPPGFSVSLFASGLSSPRFLAVAPNGDVFLSEPEIGAITLLREQGGRVKASTFAKGFSLPSGVAFHDGALYVGDLDAVWKIPYKDGQARAKRRIRVTAPRTLGRPDGHFTRNIAFAPDGTLFVAIGSHDNVGENPQPEATVQTVGPSGALSTFASGLRNPVGIAFYPGTDKVFVTVNERDGLGDGLVPDFLTHLEKGAFYGWPYAYIGSHPDPDYGAKRPDLVAKSKVPDLLFQSHSAPLGFAFYEGDQFPAEYKGDAFVALHGSWNSSKPTGYKIVRVHFVNGMPAGGYEDFVTGFWDGKSSPARVWGRPTGVAVAKDGSLLIADDRGKAVWRVSYKRK